MTGTTDASGDLTMNSAERELVGTVEAVFIDGVATTDSADFDLNPVWDEGAAGTELVGADIIDHGDIGNAAINEVSPRGFAHLITGADAEVVAGTKALRNFPLARCGLRAVVAAGGDTKAVKVWVLINT